MGIYIIEDVIYYIPYELFSSENDEEQFVDWEWIIMQGQKKLRKKNIQRYMLKSYLIIACISVFVELILCAYMIINTGIQLKQNHQMELDKAALLMDGMLADISEQTNQLSDHLLVQKILGYSAYPKYHGSDILDIQDMMELFQNKISYYSQIEDIILLNPIKSTAISSEAIFHQEFFDSFLKDRGIDLSKFKEVSGSQRTLLYIVNQERKSNDIYYVHGVYRKSYVRPDGYLMVKIDMNSLNNLLQTFESQRGSKCYLVDKNSGYLGSNQEDAILVSEVMEDGQSEGTVFVKGGRFAYSLASSDYMNIEYCYVTEQFKYYREVYVALILTVISVICMVVVSFILARRFTEKNTQPLRKIMGTIQNNDDQDNQFDYDQMVSGVTGIVGKMHSYEEKLSDDMMALIVHGQEKNKNTIMKFQKQHQNLLGDSFNVMSLKLHNLKEENDREILIFSIKNIFQELLEDYVILSPVESWDRIYFIVRPRTDEFEVQLKKGITFLLDNFGLFVVCGFGEQIHSLTQIQTSKMQADYMVEYLELTKKQVYAWYSDTITGSKKEDNDFNHNLKKLIHQIMAQDYAGCRTLLEQIFEHNIYSRTETTLSQQRMATIVSVISIPYKERYGQEEFKKTPDSLVDTYHFACHLLDRLAEGEEDEDAKTTFKRMKAYIEMNAMNPEITAGSVCNACKISASYGSGMFKKFAGEGILDAIHKERIRHAKILLKEDVSVQDVAVSVGYLDARGFIRTFKKYEGITPGQFKNI